MKERGVDYGESDRKWDKERPQYELATGLIENIAIIDNQRLLDVGCGMGEFADTIRQQYPHNEIVCVDGADRCYSSVLEKGFESYLNLTRST